MIRLLWSFVLSIQDVDLAVPNHRGIPASEVFLPLRPAQELMTRPSNALPSYKGGHQKRAMTTVPDFRCGDQLNGCEAYNQPVCINLPGPRPVMLTF